MCNYFKSRRAFLRFLLFLCIPAIFLLTTCKRSYHFETAWSSTFQELGTSSSPQCADLNRDGVLDIVMGASRNEFQTSDSSVLAIDGRTGKILWHVFAKDQIVGSAAFLDVTHDSVPDVFIGGRESEFICINGATGKQIWRFEQTGNSPIESCCLKFNFFNPQFIDDLDHDGIKDILATNGGNRESLPHSEVGRVAGVLAVFSSKTGKLIALDTLPDGKETYMSPVICDFNNDGRKSIIVGTGGETIGGSLFKVDLKELLNGDISKSKKLLSFEGRGFIAPPTLVDINNDKVKDILINWFGGSMIAIDGKTNAILWERNVLQTESYCAVVPGYFNDDNIPDFFSTYSKGSWPDNKGTIQLMVDGKNGSILYTDSLGCMGYSSAVTNDMNEDGFDEVIFSVNDFACIVPAFVGTDIQNDTHSLQLFDYHNKTRNTIVKPQKEKNISSTPWIGDLDGDHYLDIIYCVQRNHEDIIKFYGIRIVRIKTNIKISGEPTWGAYMGNDGTSIFNERKH